MCSEPVSKTASDEDIGCLPEGVTGEILAGVLHVQPRPSLFHSFVATGLCGELGSAFQRGRSGPGGWGILHKAELHLGEDVVVPDLAGWKKERLAHIPDEPFLTLAPDWVCEVTSPGTVRRDRTVKLRLYAREQVRHYWIADPRAQTIEIFRLDGEGYRLVNVCSGSEIVRAEPFDAIEMDLRELWPVAPEPGAS